MRKEEFKDSSHTRLTKTAPTRGTQVPGPLSNSKSANGIPVLTGQMQTSIRHA